MCKGAVCGFGAVVREQCVVFGAVVREQCVLLALNVREKCVVLALCVREKCAVLVLCVRAQCIVLALYVRKQCVLLDRGESLNVKMPSGVFHHCFLHLSLQWSTHISLTASKSSNPHQDKPTQHRVQVPMVCPGPPTQKEPPAVVVPLSLEQLLQQSLFRQRVSLVVSPRSQV